MCNPENKTKSNDEVSLKNILYSVLNLSEELIFTLDKDFKFSAFNEKYAGFIKDVFGIEIKVGDSYFTIPFTGSEVYEKPALERAVSGMEYTQTNRFDTQNDKKIYLDSVYSPVKDELGNIIGVIFHGRILSPENVEFQFPDELNERYYLGLEGGKAGNWEWNLKSKKAYFSPSYYTMLDYEPDEFEANEDNWINLIHPEDLGTVIEKMNNQKAHRNEFYEIEYRIKKKDGTYLWVLGRGKVYNSDEDGNPIVMKGINIDISLQKSSEMLIQELSARNKLLFDSATEIVFVIEYKDDLLSGKFLEANAAAIKTLGYSFEELSKFTLYDLFFLEQSDDFEFEHLKATGALVTEKNLLKKSGRKTAFELSFNFVSYHENPYLLVIGRDIEERKSKERNLNDIVSQWQTTFDAVGDSICLIDGTNVVRRCNKAMLELLEIEEKDVIGKKCWEVFHGTDGPIIECPVSRAKCSLSSEEKELPYKGKYFNVIAYPTTNEDGKYTGAIHILRDITEPKNSEMQMLETEIRLKEAHRIAKMGEWEHDIQKNIISCSEELSYLLDFQSKDDSISYGEFLKLIHTDDRNNFIEKYNKSQKEKIRFNFNYKIVDSSNNYKYIHHICQTIFDDLGNPGISFGILQDVTEKIKSENLNKLNEMRMKALLELADMTESDESAIISFALEEGVRLTNSKIGYLHFVNSDSVSLQLFTWSKEVTKNCTAVKEDKYPLSSAGIWADCVRLRKPVFHNDYPNNPERKGLPDGHIPLFKHLSIPVLDGDRIVAVAGVGNKEEDYNETDAAQLELFMNSMWALIVRKRTTLQLHKLSRAVEQSPVSIMITNKEGVIEYVNPKFFELTGYRSSEIIGNKPSMLKSGLVSDDIYEKLWSTIIAGNEWKGEILNKKKNGELFWESIIISPIRDSNKNITHFIAVKEDITDKKRIELELLAAKENAESANKAKSDFLANMSHELRTPLHGIIGFTNILLDEQNLSKEQIEYVDIIKSSSNNLFLLIQDILEFSKIESGNLVNENENFNFEDLISSNFSAISSIAEAKGINLIKLIAPECSAFFGDKKQINLILSNLITNAAKYSKAGNIKVEIKIQDTLNISVSDSGIGIPQNSINTIFEPFKQLEDPYVKKHQGIGLGLAIVNKSVQLLKGTIEVISEPENGSTFTVKLPVFKKHNDKSAPHHLYGAGNPDNIFESKLVLIVEDDFVNLKLLKKYLNKNGIICDTADTGEMAVEMANIKAYDAILMDLGLPDMNGIETTKQIRQFSKTPIIAITAHAYNRDRENCLEAGMNDYLAKPVEEKNVIKCLEAIFKEK